MCSALAQIIRLLPALLALAFAFVMPAPVRGETTPPPAETQNTTITINVFGAVEKPGAYPLPKNSTLLDALGAAGGWKPGAKLKQISSIRGPAGEKPVVTIHDLDAILRGDLANPKLQDHDSVFVPVMVF